MYAAAGGASLASRQARQRQRQQNKTKALQAKLQKPKPLIDGTATLARVQQQSRQFHQLPSSYLRTPQAQARKLSSSYTTQSKLLLPIVEGDTQPHHPQHHHNHHHQHTDSNGRQNTPKLVHRHSGTGGAIIHSHYLPKSATATLPLVSQADSSPPLSPGIFYGQQRHPVDIFTSIDSDSPARYGPGVGTTHIQIPQDGIIITPATPSATPGRGPSPVAKNLSDHDEDESKPPSAGQLERKCSFYRMRKSDDGDHEDETGILTSPTMTNGQAYDIYADDPIGYSLYANGTAAGRKWAQCAYCEEGICSCEHIECAQGRAAWLERGRRCSVQDNKTVSSCHRKWVKRNRIQDLSNGGSSDDEDFLGVLRGPSSFANAFLYVGLGTVALGLVIAFVGTGEKGFKTTELRLIGPSLIGIGVICCVLRILFCICPSHCISSNKKNRKKISNKVDADHTTSLLRGENKRVSIARPQHSQKFSPTHKTGNNNKMLNEGMEALRQIATTSLFLQNEQKPSTNRVVPIIKEPVKPSEASFEMEKIDTTLNICDISDEELDDDENTATHNIDNNYIHQMDRLLERTPNKLSRQRVPVHRQPNSAKHSSKVVDTSEAQQMETSLIVINPSPTKFPDKATLPSSSGCGHPPPIPHLYRMEEQNIPGQAIDTETSRDRDQTREYPLPGSSFSQLQSTAVKSPPTTGSAILNIAPPPAPSIHSKPELLLSPSKLGQ